MPGAENAGCGRAGRDLARSSIVSMMTTGSVRGKIMWPQAVQTRLVAADLALHRRAASAAEAVVAAFQRDQARRLGELAEQHLVGQHLLAIERAAVGKLVLAREAFLGRCRPGTASRGSPSCRKPSSIGIVPIRLAVPQLIAAQTADRCIFSSCLSTSLPPEKAKICAPSLRKAPFDAFVGAMFGLPVQVVLGKGDERARFGMRAVQFEDRISS